MDLSETKSETASRVYTIPLRRAWITPRHRRAKRVINLIREFARRHMKAEEVKVDQELNRAVWRRGIRFPPRRLRVTMEKDEEGVVTVTLVAPAKPEIPQAAEEPASETPSEPSPSSETARAPAAPSTESTEVTSEGPRKPARGPRRTKSQ